jgi:hypothetical protein
MHQYSSCATMAFEVAMGSKELSTSDATIFDIFLIILQNYTTI